MTANPFPDWLLDVAADAVVVLPNDADAEAQGNLWTFGLDSKQRSVVTSHDIEEFVLAVAAARGCWLAARGAASMRFYCWHDGQAGQLRFSLSSRGLGDLPFKCPIDATVGLAAVARDFLDARAEAPPALLPVWVSDVP